jgi:two-component system phosphate regulon response regulator OmpR
MSIVRAANQSSLDPSARMDATAHILIVEDEEDLRDGMADYLGLHGLTVTACADGRQMDAALAAGLAPAIVLLDINLPGESGLDLARRLRALPRPPGVIMVTALGTTLDRVIGLELGADDYIAKPFETRELLARVRSVLRRVRSTIPAAPRLAPAAAAPAAATGTTALRFAGFVLDLERRRLTDAAGREITLTTMEFDLLRTLAARPNRVLSRDQLLDLAHGKELEPFDRSIDIRITRLRKKLGDDAASPKLIRTIRGAGYMFAPDGPEAS